MSDYQSKIAEAVNDFAGTLAKAGDAEVRIRENAKDPQEREFTPVPTKAQKPSEMPRAEPLENQEVIVPESSSFER